jgi:GrpB-like predicted nucleotidyltransferase (UPF0157 family)
MGGAMTPPPDVDEPVEILPYDSAWEAAAREEIERLRPLLADWTVEIEHVGSTALPGCAAKPVIDLLVGTTAPPRRVARTVARAGYESLGEASPGRVYLRRRDGRSFNVHVVELEGELWNDNLAFRDYLRAHDDERDRYVAAKRRAAQTQPTLLAYSSLKEPVVRALLERARRYAAASAPRPE